MEQSKPNDVAIFLQALMKLCIFSIIIGGGLGYAFHSWAIGIICFLVAGAAQVAGHNIVMLISDRRNNTAEFLAEQVLREASQRKLPYELNCAYCNTLNRVGISFINENIFTCSKCNQPNKVFIQFETVRITTPLTQKENISGVIDIDGDPGVSQSTINDPIKVN